MKNQYANINLIKLVACLMVIFIHVSAINFPNINSISWDISNWYNSFSRVCVPLFFMISGALLFREKISLKKFYSRRYVKIFIPLVSWSFIYFFYPVIYGVEQKKNIIDMLYAPISVHLWYLYALIGLYLIVPLLSKLYYSCNSSEKLLVIAIWLITSSIIPTLNYSTSININLNLYGLNLIPGYIGYFFLGKYIFDVELNKRKIYISLIIYFLSSTITVLLTEKYTLESNKPISIFYSYLSPFVVISASSLFLFLNNIKIKSKYLSITLGVISSCSLGIYCLQSMMINEFFYKFRINGSTDPAWFNIPFTSISVFLLCLLICYPMSKIKFFNRIV
ncbi:TPA: acyltransferase [Providencia alcalifaciens]